MALIINLDTSTRICSVALASGHKLLGTRESRDEKSHSSRLSVFIDELLKENNLKVPDLDAIAVSTGPGSYTGLRIGVSTAKGLAYGSKIPLIGIGTLDALASGALKNPEVHRILQENKSARLCPMIDARRMEVYTALYSSRGKRVSRISATIVDENSFRENLDAGPVIFFGNGAGKCSSKIIHPSAVFIEGIETLAEYMITLSVKSWQQKRFENIAYFEPHYLKDFIATIPRSRIFPDKRDEG